jgi:hypothetical protein
MLSPGCVLKADEGCVKVALGAAAAGAPHFGQNCPSTSVPQLEQNATVLS